MLIFSVSFQFFRMHPRREHFLLSIFIRPKDNFEFCSSRGWVTGWPGRVTGHTSLAPVVERRVSKHVLIRHRRKNSRVFSGNGRNARTIPLWLPHRRGKR